MIDINETELSEDNYEEFMSVLDAEFVRQYPSQLQEDYKHSETVSKEEWLQFDYGQTVQEIIDNDVDCWED